MPQPQALLVNIPTDRVEEVKAHANEMLRLYGADRIVSTWIASDGEIRVELAEGTHPYMAD
jgi:hypothetical protein